MPPFRCPICYGKGKVPGGFYLGTRNIGTSSTSEETCKTCGGNGIIRGE